MGLLLKSSSFLRILVTLHNNLVIQSQKSIIFGLKLVNFGLKLVIFSLKLEIFFQQIHCGWVTQPKIGLDEALRPTYLVAYLPSGLSISLFIYRPIYIGLAFYRPSFLSAYLSIGLSI